MKRFVLSVLAFGVVSFSGAFQAEVSSEKSSTELFVTLPEYCPTPDAFAIAPDGSLTLSCPNYAAKDVPGLLVRISAGGKVSKLTEIHGPDGVSKAHPMGIAYAPDGSLFVCANKGANNGRLLRLSFDNGLLVKTETVASGLNGNGLRYHKGALYVTLPKMPGIKGGKNTGGVYRFLETDRDIQIKGDATDDRLIFTAKTQNPDRQFGLDGLVFDHEGRLLVADFGDGTIYRLRLNDTGQVLKKELYAQLPNTAGADGMVMDDRGNLYIAGFSQNIIFKVDTDRIISVIAQNPDSNGKNGELDQPADLIIYEGKLVISNFDLMVQSGMLNSQHSHPYTLSVLDLTE